MPATEAQPKIGAVAEVFIKGLAETMSQKPDSCKLYERLITSAKLMGFGTNLNATTVLIGRLNQIHTNHDAPALHRA